MRTPPSAQAPSAVVLVRPHRFSPNPATTTDNAFQSTDPTRDAAALAADAYAEATGVADALRATGVRVHVFEDTDDHRPDAVFPNNWFSTHAGGRVALYPMYSPSRRTERRADVVDLLARTYRVQEVVDYSPLEHDDVFLEGTGAMVLDHLDRVAYTARSHRANPDALFRFCSQFGYEPLVVDAADGDGTPIYHTNVLMCIATDVALVGLDLITAPAQRRLVAERLRASGRRVVALDERQVREFAGNAIEVRGRRGRVLVMSTRAAASLTAPQRRAIERTTPILALDIPTIELAGGSVRCMVAGIHLSPRDVRPARASRERVSGARTGVLETGHGTVDPLRHQPALGAGQPG
ncbi:citrulline utilization hydrolase CtlX [Cellulomonas sp. PhB143]|uniref:citrulline utilization hydrolase CtlX n=1 Tax=Cellulomonas sp. PhB143 TaxID=2485186 RepID=UPI000F48DED6|nr:arginine deiminase-related protein [Cellulomonas sp. PhB143]ROS75384.1 hypothetical protein EDF32_1793 [Cellulomonas sp. PhB143]